MVSGWTGGGWALYCTNLQIECADMKYDVVDLMLWHLWGWISKGVGELERERERDSIEGRE